MNTKNCYYCPETGKNVKFNAWENSEVVDVCDACYTHLVIPQQGEFKN